MDRLEFEAELRRGGYRVVYNGRLNKGGDFFLSCGLGEGFQNEPSRNDTQKVSQTQSFSKPSMSLPAEP